MSSRKPPLLENSPAMQRILTAIQVADMIPIEISKRADVAISTLTDGGHLKAMRAQGHIHISGWCRPKAQGNWAPIYRAGAGTDAPQPKAPDVGKVRILRAMQTDHLTVAAMADRFKASRGAIWRHVRALHDLRQIHVCAYRKDGASTVYAAVYAYGDGDDAAEPEERYTRQVRVKRAKMKSASPRALTMAGQLGV